jgi:RNA polymerase sigma-70 factor (ECF subfamily)
MVDEEQAAVVSAVRVDAGVRRAELDDFEPVVKLHQRRVYRVLLGMVRDPDTAANLTQECFLKAYRRRASFRGEASVGVWLVKIAVNLARDHRRSRLRDFWQRLFAASAEVADLTESLPDPHPSAERVLLAQEEAATVWSATEKLSAQQRAVFILRFVEEMSLEEISQATSLKMGTVKAHLFRAIGSIRQRIKEGKQRE